LQGSRADLPGGAVLQLGPYASGWVLPTAAQLFSLVHTIGTGPLLLGTTFTNTSGNNSPYWSSTVDASTGTNWVLQFTTADFGPASSNMSPQAVRCLHH
jgi:hypothetical protein